MTSPPPPPDATEVDLLLRLARRWRSVGMEESAEHGLSPHQERALLALARLSRRLTEGHDGGPGRGGEGGDGGVDGGGDGGDGGDGGGDGGGGIRVSHLADHLGIAPRSATEVADALESAGLLSRSPDPTDRRAVLLALTGEGRHTVGRVRERRRAAADEAVSTLSPHDRAELRRLLEALLTAS